MDCREGGPGRISVAKVGSPSRCGGCTTGTVASRQAGTPSTDAIQYLCNLSQKGVPKKWSEGKREKTINGADKGWSVRQDGRHIQPR